MEPGPKTVPAVRTYLPAKERVQSGIRSFIYQLPSAAGDLAKPGLYADNFFMAHQDNRLIQCMNLNRGRNGLFLLLSFSMILV
jgi:hypothetical protein